MSPCAHQIDVPFGMYVNNASRSKTYSAKCGASITAAIDVDHMADTGSVGGSSVVARQYSCRLQRSLFRTYYNTVAVICVVAVKTTQYIQDACSRTVGDQLQNVRLVLPVPDTVSNNAVRFNGSASAKYVQIRGLLLLLILVVTLRY